MLIFLSFLFVLLFGFMGVLTLNYAIFTWENKRVRDLTNQIKPSETNLSPGGTFTKNFSSVDLNDSINKSRTLQVAGQIYDKAMITITNQEYPSWVNKLIDEINLFRKNAWKSLSRLFNYLISLTKPVHNVGAQTVEPKDEIKHEQKTQEIFETIDKVERINSASKENLAEDEMLQQHSEEHVKDVDYTTPSAEKEQESQENLATISFAGNSSQKDPKTISIFEKLEARILEKLKTSGYDQYDIWLELGSLYEKYGEKDKAAEVYALVLKHSEAKEKDLARDKLIGLSA